MTNGIAPVSATRLNKRRMVNVSLGLACTLSVSAGAVSAQEHMPVVDPTVHSVAPDAAVHINVVDTVQHTAVDPTAHLNVVDVAQPVMPVDPTVHFTTVDPTHMMVNTDPTAHLNIVDPTHSIMSDPSVHINVADPISTIDPVTHQIADPTIHQTIDPTAHNLPDAAAHSQVDPTAHTTVDPTAHSATDPTAGAGHNTGSAADASNTAGADGTTTDTTTHAATADAQGHDASMVVHTTAPHHDLNLSSTSQDFLAGNLANFHTITIDVGGVKETVDVHTKLTAAEYVAAEQVLNDGVQTIQLGGHGEAVGGLVVLDSSLMAALNGQIGNLTISHGVQLIDAVDTFSLLGDLNNYGSILMGSSVAGQSDTISANSIINSFEGMIGSYTGGLYGLFAADPILSALTSITNFGTISSAGNLTITAPEVFNLSTANTTAAIGAANSVDINTNHLVNSGDIASAFGNINIDGGSQFALDGLGGAMRADSGVIDILTHDAPLSVMGGSFYSKELTAKAGHSTVNIQAERVSGRLNASGDNVHLYVSDSDLRLGDIDAYGDPTLSSQNNIIIDGTIAPTGGANLAIVSGKNILSGAGGQLDTRNLNPGGGNGGNLSLVAGANFTVDGSGNVVLTDSANAGKGSVTGGFIDLTGGSGGTGAISSITTAGTGASGNAGYIQMVAYVGNGAGAPIAPGSIVIPNSVTINAGSANGQRGDVSIIAGTNNSLGYSGGGIIGKNISIGSYNPTVGAGMFFDGTGTASNGINSFSNSAGAPKNGFFSLTGDLSATGDINIGVGSWQQTGNIFADGFGGQSVAGQMNGGAGHAVNISALQSISVQGNISATGGGGAGSGSSTAGLAGGAGGAGGTVNINRGASPVATVVSGSINVSGGGGGGGAGGSQTAAATSGGAGGLAGTVKIVSNTGAFNAAGGVLAYDGGAGGAGGSSPTGVGAGGGGGSAHGGAGGGGGGGTGTSASDFGAGGGGGYSLVSGGGGGGGGVYGNASGGTLSVGGSGGSASGLAGGLGGFGDVVGSAASGHIGGNGGGIASPGAGGTGATSVSLGGNGGQSNQAGLGIGAAGSGARVVTGHGLIDITANTVNQRIETGAFKGLAGSFQGQMSIISAGGTALDLLGLGSSNGIVSLTTTQNAGVTGADGTINVLGNIVGQQATLNANGNGGPNNINISAQIGASSLSIISVVNLTSNGGVIQTLGTGLLSGTQGSITATNGINVNANVGTSNAAGGPAYNFNSSNGNVLINQGTSIANIGGSAVAGGSFTVHSQNSMILNPITVNGGTITFDTNGGTGNLTVVGPVSTGNTSGSISLTTSGTGNITQSTIGTGLFSNSINLNTNGNIGTLAAPLKTSAVNNGTVTAISSATGNVYLNDSATGNVTINAPTTSTGTLSLVSQAAQLNVPNANYSNVSIINNNGGGNVLLNSGNNMSAVLGNGSGSFAVTAGGNIDANQNTDGIKGTSVSLISNNGSIGSARRITASAPTLTARALNGSVDLETPNATTINGGAAGTFNLIDNVSGSAVTVNGPIAANNVNIQAANASALNINGSLGKSTATNIDVASGGSVGFSDGATLTAQNIELSSGTNTINLGSNATSTGLQLTSSTGTAQIAISPEVNTADNISAQGNLEFHGQYQSFNPINMTAAGSVTVGGPADSTSSISGTVVNVAGQSINNYGAILAPDGLSLVASAGNITNNAGARFWSNFSNMLLDVSATNGTVNNAGEIMGGELYFATGTGAVNNSSGANIWSWYNTTFDASAVSNFGFIQAYNGIFFNNPTGNISITGAPDSILPVSRVGFTAGNNISLDPDILRFSNNLSEFKVNAGGTFTSSLSAINTYGYQPIIDINASDVVFANPSTSLALNANASDRGTINLNLFGSTGGITVGTAGGNFQISARGGNGGNVTINTPGNLTINTPQFDNRSLYSGAGGNLSFTSGGNILLKGNLDTHNDSGSYGNITFNTGSSSQFLIDGTKTNTVNGQIGIANGEGIFGKTVIFNNAAGVSLANHYALTGTDELTINGSNLTNNGTINTKQLQVQANGNVTFSTGTTGSYQNQPLDVFRLRSDNGNITATGSIPSAHQIDLYSPFGTLTLGSGITSLNATPDASGNGGYIGINANDIVSGPLAMNAAATTGSGGQVFFNIIGNQREIKFGQNAYSLNIANGSGQPGGFAQIINGNNIKIDLNYVNLGSATPSGQGAEFRVSTNGKLFIDNTVSLPSTTKLILASTAHTDFVLGGASSNGSGFGDNNKTLTVESISLSNSGGDILRGNNKGIIANGVSLQAGGSGDDHTAGDIGTSSKNIIVDTDNLSLNAQNGSAFVTLQNSPNTVFFADVSDELQVTSTGGLNLNSPLRANELTLNVGSINTFDTNASSIEATIANGDFVVNDTNVSGVTLKEINVSGNLSVASQALLHADDEINAGGSVAFNSAAGITTDDEINAGGTVTFTAANGIVTDDEIHAGGALTFTSGSGGVSIGDGMTAGGAASLTANGGGSIIAASGGTGSYRVVAHDINLLTDGGNIGTASRAFRTQGAVLNVNTNGTGNVWLRNTNTASSGTVALQYAPVGSLNFTEDNTTSHNNGKLLINGSIVSNGEIFVTSNEKSLEVGSGASLTTQDGNITLQNTYSKNGANLPSIYIGDNVNIHGSSFGSLNTGNVYIVLGNVPSNADLRPGVAPTGGSPTINGTVYFGTKQNPTGSITTNSGDVLQGLARNLVFNNNKLGNAQITLGQNVTIVADPPLAPGESAADFGTMSYGASSGASSNAAFGNATGGAAQLQFVGGLQPSSIPLAAMAGSLPMSTSESSVSPVSAVRSNAFEASIPAISASLAAALNAPAIGTGVSDALLERVEEIGNSDNSKMSAERLANAKAAVEALLGPIVTVKGQGAKAVSSAAIGNAITATDNLTALQTATSASTTRLSGNVTNVTRRSIQKGAMLMAPESNTVIDTPHGSVGVSAGSVALLIASDKGLAVYDLHDNKKGSVVITGGGNSTSLIPGRSAFLTKASAGDFGEVNPIKFVGYRHVVSRDLAESKLYQADFEILTMVRGLKPLGGLVDSTNPKARKTMDNMLKTAAILLELGHGGEQFKYYLPKELVAYMASRKAH